MTLMYCKKCNANVLVREEDFNIVLAVILAIFTGGLGLLIYVAIYLEKRRKCVHCNTVCKVEVKEVINDQPQTSYQVISTSHQSQNPKSMVQTQLLVEGTKFCYSCGTELDQSEDAKFCRFCGTNIQ
ncbi:MAG: hypothetical protein ACXABO_20910 [Promethearchaeota archaeon]|jgi:hypothetical protein